MKEGSGKPGALLPQHVQTVTENKKGKVAPGEGTAEPSPAVLRCCLGNGGRCRTRCGGRELEGIQADGAQEEKMLSAHRLRAQQDRLPPKAEGRWEGPCSLEPTPPGFTFKVSYLLRNVPFNDKKLSKAQFWGLPFLRLTSSLQCKSEQGEGP